MLKAIYQSVFRPSEFYGNPKGQLLVDRYGWMFIGIRWLYYSVVFTVFRDYRGPWKPFVAPPFGINIDTYASLQRYLSVVFGFILMTAIAVSMVTYLRVSGKDITTTRMLNLLGVTFFLPFVILQILDFMIMTTQGWLMSFIIPLHTSALLWESIATVLILHTILSLRTLDKIFGVILIMAVWILLCALFWR